MKKAIIILIGCVLCAVGAEAQTFTDRLQQQKAGKGTVTLHQSKEIDKLVNGRYSDPNAAGMRPDVKPEQPEKAGKEKKKADWEKDKAPKAAQTAPARQPQQAQQSAQTAHNAQPKQDTAPADTTPDMGKKVMRRSYKTMGYRVQVWAGGNSRDDRQKAERAGQTIKRRMPGVPVYVHFYSPRWICRIGNYLTYENAYEALREVKQIGYPEAVIVKGTVTVQY